MASVRPVNRVLGFGIRGITPVALSPWMLTCNRSNAVACLTDTLNKHSTHSQVSINKCAVVSVKVVSARKEARSAHVEISKMDVQDEGRKERRALKAQSCREVKHACVYFYRNTNTCRRFISLVTTSRNWDGIESAFQPVLIVESCLFFHF